jgi:hypothetical protein
MERTSHINIKKIPPKRRDLIQNIFVILRLHLIQKQILFHKIQVLPFS